MPKSFDLKGLFDDPDQMGALILSLKEYFEGRSFVPTSELTKFLVDVLKCETNRIAPLYARLVNLQNGFHLEHANKGEVQGYKAVYSDRERNPRKHPDVIGGNANTLNVITSKLREIEGLLRASADEIHSLIGSIETFGPSFERLTQLEEVMKTLQGALPK